jgi:hypothetical protein
MAPGSQSDIITLSVSGGITVATIMATDINLQVTTRIEDVTADEDTSTKLQTNSLQGGVLTVRGWVEAAGLAIANVGADVEYTATLTPHATGTNQWVAVGKLQALAISYGRTTVAVGIAFRMRIQTVKQGT